MRAQTPPKILGILNITEDSFSDGGLFLEPQSAVKHARKLIKDGADILDVGAASSHPDACDVSHAQEKKRLQPVLDALLKEKTPLSVDSFSPQTQLYAIKKGVDYLNDIQGFPNPEIYQKLAKAPCKLIVMHSVQAKGKASYDPPPLGSIKDAVCQFFDERLQSLTKAGVPENQIIIDPGMGFFLGNSPQTSFKILGALAEIKARYRLPLLISVSRKSFLQKTIQAPPEETASATLAAEIYAALQGVDYIRTHEPKPLHHARAILSQIASSSKTQSPDNM